MRRTRAWLCPAITVLAVLGTAAPAHAGNGVVTRSADGTELRLTFTDERDSLFLTSNGDPFSGNIVLDENQGAATTITGSGDHGCTPVSGNTDDLSCPRMHNGKAAQRLVVDYNGGDDYSEIVSMVVEVQIVLNGGDGSDTLWGSEDDDVIDGGPGPDSILGFRGDDTLRGGSGDDELDGYEESDDISGGDGFDTAFTTNRDFNEGVHISLDDVANDGVQSGAEGDNIHSDVEDLDGTGFDDRLIGDASPNIFYAGGGNDFIDGGGGGDRFEAGDGDDIVMARDGQPERIECGDGNDQLTADDVDQHDGCEQVSASPELQTDLDGDGAARPADCDDRNPAVRPGAPEISDNGIDDDCRDGDAINLDRDGDGSPRPFDCDDTSAAVRPGAAEVFGNRVDEDCSGRANPFQQILSGVPNAFRRSRGVVTVTRLGVRDVVKGMTIELHCSGRGCPFKTRRRTVRKKAALLNLLPTVRRARLRNGATLEVRITQSGAIGKVVRFSVGRRGLPTSRTLCLKPGDRRPSSC